MLRAFSDPAIALVFSSVGNFTFYSNALFSACQWAQLSLYLNFVSFMI